MKSNIYTKCCEKCTTQHENYDPMFANDIMGMCHDKNCPCHQNHKEAVCLKCLAHNIGPNHECPPLMKFLKEEYDKNVAPTSHQQWEEKFDVKVSSGDFEITKPWQEGNEVQILYGTIKQFISSLLQEERERNYNEGYEDAKVISERKGRAFGATQERERITKILEGMKFLEWKSDINSGSGKSIINGAIELVITKIKEAEISPGDCAKPRKVL